jgi:hypothetical protein
MQSSYLMTMSHDSGGSATIKRRQQSAVRTLL